MSAHSSLAAGATWQESVFVSPGPLAMRAQSCPVGTSQEHRKEELTPRRVGQTKAHVIVQRYQHLQAQLGIARLG